MRRSSLALLLPALALSFAATRANAQVDYDSSQRYQMTQPGMINAAYQPAVETVSPRRIYEHAFFTPVANFQQEGYQCAGMVSVSFSRGKRVLHRGTYCIR
jgi:hypothetical protein